MFSLYFILLRYENNMWIFSLADVLCIHVASVVQSAKDIFPFLKNSSPKLLQAIGAGIQHMHSGICLNAS